MFRRSALAIAVASLFACATPKQEAPAASTTAPPESPAAAEQPAQAQAVLPAAPAQAERLDKDTELSTPGGARFTAAAGWFVTRLPDHLVLEDPDRELKVYLLENTAADGDVALQQAWQRAQPGFAREVEHRLTAPARQGWDETVTTYHRSALEEKRAVQGIARRKGQAWHVTLVDGKEGAIDRRGAQVALILTSYKPEGFAEETFAGKTPRTLGPKEFAELESFVRDAMALTQVPGAAIAIIQDGKVVYEGGFGVRELGMPGEVTPSTLFMIGSTTKSLTSLMMAKLVDEGRVQWTTPVTQLMRSFKLGDPEATRKLNLEHTMCACTGLPRQDMEFIFEFGQATPEARVASMASMKPTTGFGETFQYSNSLVSTGGYVAAMGAAPGRKMRKAYEEAMRTRVLEPLKMHSTTFSIDWALKAGPAMPHAMDAAMKMRPLNLGFEGGVESVAPAGGAWSTARDLSRWLITELNEGVDPDGKRYISAAPLLERRNKRVAIGAKAAYGLGLFLEDDTGVRIVGHGGNTMGFTSDAFFIPEAKVGAVVLTNAGRAGNFRAAVRRRILELVYDGKQEAKENLEVGWRQRVEITQKEQAKLTRADEAWLEPLLGRWSHPDLGTVDIRRIHGRAYFDAGEWATEFQKRVDPDGTVKVVFTGPELAFFELVAGMKDGKATLAAELPQQRYEFKHVR